MEANKTETETVTQVSSGETYVQSTSPLPPPPPPPPTHGENYKRNLARVISSTSSKTLGSTMGSDEKSSAIPMFKPSLKRYVILLLFCFQSGNKSYQWLSVAAAGTKATVLYDTTHDVINFCSTIFMFAFILLSWPACFIIENLGLRNVVLIAAFGATLGAVVKCFSCVNEGIWLLVLGQFLVALAEQLIFSLPSRLASVWFPDHQVSLCVALCVAGNQMGYVMGFLVPQWFLAGTETQEEIARGFYHMYLWTAGASIVFFLACVLLFDDQPKRVPGAARARQLEVEAAKRQTMLDAANNNGRHQQRQEVSMLAKLRDLLTQISHAFRDPQLMLLSTSYGITVGLNYTVTSLLDQLLKPIWPHDDLVVGNAGFLIIVAGIMATPIWGRAMDRWHAYKLINLIIAMGTLAALCLLFYALVALKSITCLYVGAALYGAFSIGFIVSGLEYAVELTYPAPELITSSAVNLMPQLHSIVYIFAGSHIADAYGLLPASIFYLALMALAVVFLLATRETLKRQAAIKQMGEKAPPRRALAMH